jgi:hypothetical protein
MSFVLSRYLVFLPKPTRPPVAQFFPAWTFVVDPLPDSQHFLIPVVAGAHRDAESVARLPNRVALDEDQPMKLWLLRLGWVMNSSPEPPIDNEASLATRIHAAPGSRAGTVASPAVCLSATEDAWRVEYCSSNTVPRKDEIEQRVQQVLPALLRITRPDE